MHFINKVLLKKAACLRQRLCLYRIHPGKLQTQVGRMFSPLPFTLYVLQFADYPFPHLIAI